MKLNCFSEVHINKYLGVKRISALYSLTVEKYVKENDKGKKVTVVKEFG